MKFLILTCIFGWIIFYHQAAAQTSDSIAIPTNKTGFFKLGEIKILGNKKTKSYIIERELKVKAGDTLVISNLYETIAQCKDLVYNTNLFSSVAITPIVKSAFEIDLVVTVNERWYVYPSPQFKLTDRNFNEWWKEYNHDFDRVIYGIKFSHQNMTGRGDQIAVYWLNGYARNYTLGYQIPYVNKQMTRGLAFSVNYIESREFPYQTSYSNKLLQFQKDQFTRKSFSASASLRMREGYYKKSSLGIQINNIQVSDSILNPKYNPNYFNVNESSLWFIDAFYSYQYINVDNVNYPRKGKFYLLNLNKRGVGWRGGVNMFAIDFSINKYYKLPRKFSGSIILAGKLKLPFEQPYLNLRNMGYGNYYVNGLEYYVIDGVASGLAKFGLNKKILHFKIPFPFRIKEIPYVPFTFFIKTYADMGYVYNKPNYSGMLNNKFLYSSGIGIDVLSLYDLRLSVEYSMNQLGEKGLFLHTRGNL